MSLPKILDDLNLEQLEPGEQTDAILRECFTVLDEEKPSTSFRDMLTLASRLNLRLQHKQDGPLLGFQMQGDAKMTFPEKGTIAFVIAKRLLTMAKQGHDFTAAKMVNPPDDDLIPPVDTKPEEILPPETLEDQPSKEEMDDRWEQYDKTIKANDEGLGLPPRDADDEEDQAPDHPPQT